MDLWDWRQQSSCSLNLTLLLCRAYWFGFAERNLINFVYQQVRCSHYLEALIKAWTFPAEHNWVKSLRGMWWGGQILTLLTTPSEGSLSWDLVTAASRSLNSSVNALFALYWLCDHIQFMKAIFLHYDEQCMCECNPVSHKLQSYTTHCILNYVLKDTYSLLVK